MIQKRRRFLWLFSLLGLVALYAGLGFFLVPVVARKQIEKKGSAQLKRQVSLQRVQFNPFTFAGSLERLRVAGENGGELASWAVLRFNFDPWESLLRREWRLGELSVVAPSFNLAIDPEGRLNIADILESDQPNATAEPSPPPKVGIDRLKVENGTVQYSDRSRSTPFSSTVHPIDFVLENFSTAKEAGGAYRLSGKTIADESFTWIGSLSMAPVSSRGELKFEGIRLPNYMPFVQAFLKGQISEGRLNVSAKYDVQGGKDTRALITDLALRLAQLKLNFPQGTPAATLTSLEMDAPELNVITRTAHVARIAVEGVKIQATRGQDGTIDLVNLIATSPPDQASAASASTGPQAKPFAISVDNVGLTNGAVTFSDHTLEEPAHFQLDQIHFTATGFGPALDKPVAVEMGLRLENGPATLTAKGTVRPQPLGAEIDLTGSELPIALASAYLKPMTNVKIASGGAEFNGHLHLAQTEGGPMAIAWSGSAAIHQLGLVGANDSEPLIQWSRVGVTGVDLDLQARQVQVQEVQINQPALHVLMKEDGSLNFTTMLKAGTVGANGETSPNALPTAAPPPGDATTAAPPPFSIKVASVSLTDGSITFTDHSTQPVPEAKITAISGTLTQLSTQAESPSQVDLTAIVLQSPPASIKGKINLLGKDVFAGSDLAVDMKGVRLEALEPYVMKYLGYKIQKGRMEGDFDYRLSGEALQGQNHVVLDNFYLGEPVQSPVAMSLPIKLALAVMRNREGKVILNVPVSGTITSPQFSFAEAIHQALQNSLSKVVSAPFALLGSLFGSPDADLSQVSFSSGGAELSEEAKRNLDTLARALQERPDLQLTLRWVPAATQDQATLAAQQVQTLIDQKKQQLSSAGQGVSDDQALLALYQERVPAGLPKSETEPEQALAAPNESVRPPWYVRLYRFVFRPSAVASRTSPSESKHSPEIAADLTRVRHDLAGTVRVEPQAFIDLARSRAEAAQTYLKQAGVEAERLQIATEPGAPEGKPTEGPNVYFALDEKPPAS